MSKMQVCWLLELHRLRVQVVLIPRRQSNQTLSRSRRSPRSLTERRGIGRLGQFDRFGRGCDQPVAVGHAAQLHMRASVRPQAPVNQGVTPVVRARRPVRRPVWDLRVSTGLTKDGLGTTMWSCDSVNQLTHLLEGKRNRQSGEDHWGVRMLHRTRISAVLLTLALVVGCGRGSESATNVAPPSQTAGNTRNLGAGETLTADVPAQKSAEAAHDVGPWTPEGIAANPAGYIDWSLGELDKLEAKLKGHRLEVQAVGHKYAREGAVDAALAEPRAKQLNELVELYKDHERRFAWPAKYRNVPIDKETLRRMILEAGRTAQAERARSDLAPKVQARVDKEAREIEDKLGQIAVQRVKLVEARRLITLNQDISRLNALVRETGDLFDKTDAAADFGKIEVAPSDFLPTAKEASDDLDFAKLLSAR